jgi:hypothetical protein
MQVACWCATAYRSAHPDMAAVRKLGGMRWHICPSAAPEIGLGWVGLENCRAGRAQVFDTQIGKPSAVHLVIGTDIRHWQSMTLSLHFGSQHL